MSRSPWRVSGLGTDLLAGCALAAIAIPGQMATARLAGFHPELGFTAFVAGTAAFAVLGANRRLSCGADSTIAPIFAGTIALIAVPGSSQYIALAVLLAMMVGAVVAAAGALRLGWIANTLSQPVIIGFLAGIAARIIISQLPALLGVADGSGGIATQIASLWHQRDLFDPRAAMIGLGVLATTFAAAWRDARIPGALLALLCATGAVMFWHLHAHGIATLGALPAVVPELALPAVGLGDIESLIGLALMVSLVVMIQTAATARAFSDPDSTPASLNRDFVGIGAGSILSGLLGGFAVDASPPSTAVVASAGGRSQRANLVAAALVALLARFGGALLANIPTSALAGVLMYVALRILHARQFATIWRASRAEGALALLTCLCIIILPIQTGVGLGIFLSLAHGVFSITRTRLIGFRQVEDTTVWWPDPSAGIAASGAVMVVGFQAPLSFLNASGFRADALAALNQVGPPPHLIVLEASGIVDIDYTASLAIADIVAAVRARGSSFAIARLESLRARSACDRFGLTALIGPAHIFRSVAEAIRSLPPPPAAL